jgi:hypothetical protein
MLYVLYSFIHYFVLRRMLNKEECNGMQSQNKGWAAMQRYRSLPSQHLNFRANSSLVFFCFVAVRQIRVVIGREEEKKEEVRNKERFLLFCTLPLLPRRPVAKRRDALHVLSA